MEAGKRKVSGLELSRLLGIEGEVQIGGQVQRGDAVHTGEGRSAAPARLRLACRRLLHLALEALRGEVISRRKFQEVVRLGGLNDECLFLTSR